MSTWQQNRIQHLSGAGEGRHSLLRPPSGAGGAGVRGAMALTGEKMGKLGTDLQDFTEFYRILQNFTGFYRILKDILQNFTGLSYPLVSSNVAGKSPN